MPVQNPSPPPPPPLIISQQEGLAACARSTDNPQHSASSLPLPSLQPSGARTNGARGNGRESHTPPPAPGRSLLGRSPQRTRAHERARTRTQTQRKKKSRIHTTQVRPPPSTRQAQNTHARALTHTPPRQFRSVPALLAAVGPVNAFSPHRLCAQPVAHTVCVSVSPSCTCRLVAKGQKTVGWLRSGADPHYLFLVIIKPSGLRYRPPPAHTPLFYHALLFFFERALSLRPIDNRAHRISDRSIATHRSDVALGAKLDCPSRVLCLHFWLLFPVLLCLSVFPLSLLKSNLKTCQRFQL